MVRCPDQSTRKHASWRRENSMQIFVTGATGVPGQAGVKRLIAEDHIDITNRRLDNLMTIIQRLFAKVCGN